MTDNRDRSIRPNALTRREFLDHGAHVALGFGALAGMGLGGSAFAKGLLFADVVEESALAARAMLTTDELALGNDAITASWSIAGGAFRPVSISDHLNRTALPVPAQSFTLTLADKSTIAAGDMRITAPPRMEGLSANPRASRISERIAGRSVTLTLQDASGHIEAVWRGLLRDGSHYIRQELTLRALGATVPLREVTLLDFNVPDARVTGTVRGTPIVAANAFFAFEHPLASNGLDAQRVRCSMSRTLPLRPGTALTVSSVTGVARARQMRRDFLAYVERERAHPYRTFLHYNSWYDIGYFSGYDEAAALAAVAAFGTELHQKRSVTLDSFLFDDGWDDPKTLWRFNAGFPAGFAHVAQATHRYGAAPGVWMSPWGGYGKPREERIAHGKAEGFETNERGFALSGPVYYKRFRDTCIDMIRRYGVNQFKFDGTGNSSSTFPDSPFDSDFDAAIHLIDELRAEKPDLYVNLTTGTYPSPFWLRYADSIWRGGEDHDFAGIGSSRQRWITYRDADTYEHVVRAGALYPLNSLMLHGMIYARSAHNLMTDPGNDFSSEVRSYFGTGTQLQEMYITPALLSRGDWDTIAECARWSRANADTLVDTHWVGGDPLRLEPYGWASWSARKGILTLRNPNNVPQKISIDFERVFELPPDAPRRYAGSSPWVMDRGSKSVQFRAGEEREIRLAPLQVLTLEAIPR
jgi:hypothetical protein